MDPVALQGDAVNMLITLHDKDSAGADGWIGYAVAQLQPSLYEEVWVSLKGPAGVCVYAGS
jgi:hypothetical protein